MAKGLCSWIPGQQREFPMASAYLCRQHLILGTWRAQVPHLKKMQHLFPLLLMMFSTHWSGHSIMYIQKSVLKWDRVLMPTEKCHLPGLQREQDSPTPFIYDKNYLNLKYLKHTSSKLASISSSITLERYRN